MTTTTATRWRLVLGLVMATSGASTAGCGRGLIGISSTAHSPDRDAAPLDADDPSLPAGTSVCFADHPAACDETCKQATRILWTNCAGCHNIGAASFGVPLFDFVLDPQLLTTRRWPRQGESGVRFVVPGDPEGSAIYQRAVITQDMPPLQVDPNQPSFRRVTPSDGQILNVWITSCLGEDQGTGDGGAVGGVGLVACPAAVPSGACPIEQQGCEYASQSCVCASGQWTCTPCPMTQPAVGATCFSGAHGALPDGRNLALSCLYGNVRCSCEDDSFAEQWACGVCPDKEPQQGVACGNSLFRCAYGDDSCVCLGNSWNCQRPRCPVTGPDSQPACHGHTACQYPADQTCVCNGSSWSCSCPSSAPVEGQACVQWVSGSCAHGDQSCTCSGGAWHCLDSCPAAQPTNGASCHSALSCSYAGGLCYCAGDLWHCS